jgi:hypothetical protein
LAHDAEGSYFFSPGQQNRGRMTFPFPPVKRGTEAGGVLQKSAATLGKPAHRTVNRSNRAISRPRHDGRPAAKEIHEFCHKITDKSV